MVAVLEKRRGSEGDCHVAEESEAAGDPTFVKWSRKRLGGWYKEDRR